MGVNLSRIPNHKFIAVPRDCREQDVRGPLLVLSVGDENQSSKHEVNLTKNFRSYFAKIVQSSGTQTKCRLVYGQKTHSSHEITSFLSNVSYEHRNFPSPITLKLRSRRNTVMIVILTSRGKVK